MSRLLSQRIEWLGIRLFVPDDWQIVRHSVRREQGALVFVDRRSERLRVGWVDCRREPDIDRLVSDLRTRTSDVAVSSLALGASLEERWRGFRQLEPATGLSIDRAVHFAPASNRLVEIALTASHPSSDPPWLAELLERAHISNYDCEANPLCAFGIDIATPACFHLLEARVLAGDTRVRFERRDPHTGARDPDALVVRRRALARAWFGGDLEALIRSEEPRVRYAFTRRTLGNSAALTAQGTYPATPFQRLRGLKLVRRVLAWHAEAEDAVYELRTLSPRQRPIGPDDFSINCGRNG